MTTSFYIYSFINIVAGMKKNNILLVATENLKTIYPSSWFLYNDEEGLTLYFSQKVKTIQPTISVLLDFFLNSIDKKKLIKFKNADTNKNYRLIGFDEDNIIENSSYIIIEEVID